MHIILGLVFALGLLFWWLGGHWTGRVVGFLAFAVVLGFFGAFAAGMDARPPAANYGWLGLLLGIAAAWPVAGIPAYVRRGQPMSMTIR